jgi:hypothetical protein
MKRALESRNLQRLKQLNRKNNEREFVMWIRFRPIVLALIGGVPLLLTMALLPAAVQSQGKKPKPAFGPIAAISKDGRVERGGKPIKGAKKGFVAREGDVVKSGAKADLDLFLGTLAGYKLKPKTAMRLSKVDPPLPKEGDKVDVETRLDDGSVLLRTRKLGGQSKFILRTKEALTAIGGTAYRVRWNNTRKLSSILVAEGQVAVSKPGAAAGTETLVDARKKVVVSATGIGPVADAGPEDEAEIQELLRLRLPGEPEAPVAGGGGGEVAAAPEGPIDVNDLAVVASNLKALRMTSSERYKNRKVTYSVSWKPSDGNVVTASARETVMAITANGKRRTIPGYYLETIGNDSQTVYISKPNAGIWSFNFPNGTPRKISSEPIGFLRISPTMARIVGGLGWTRKKSGGWVSGTKGQSVFLSAKGKTLGSVKGYFNQWALGDTRAIVFNKGRSTLVDTQNPNQALSRAGFVGSVSPMGKWILGSSRPLSFTNAADGSTTKLLDPDVAPSGRWSNDDRYIEVTSMGRQVMLDPKNPETQLPLDEKQFCPKVFLQSCISPDGRLIAFSTPEGQRQVIGICDAADRQKVFLTEIPFQANGGQICWDGNRRIRSYNYYTSAVLTLGLKAGSQQGAGVNKPMPVSGDAATQQAIAAVRLRYKEMAAGFLVKQPARVLAVLTKDFTSAGRYVVRPAPEQPIQNASQTRAQFDENTRNLFPGSEGSPSRTYAIQSATLVKPGEVRVTVLEYVINPLELRSSQPGNADGYYVLDHIWTKSGDVWSLKSERARDPGYDAGTALMDKVPKAELITGEK